MRIVIVGAGEVGRYVASRLIYQNKEVVVIDKNQSLLEKLRDKLDLETIHGSGSSPKILEEAGIKDAEALLAVTDSDEINLIACTFSNILSPKITKIARIRDPDYLAYKDVLAREILNIDFIVNPESEVVSSIEKMIGLPGVNEINEFKDIGLYLVGLWIKSNSPVIGKSLSEIKAQMDVKDFIVASISREKELVIPSGADKIAEGDLIHIAVSKKELSKVLLFFGIDPRLQHNILIIGGGNIGYKLAQKLEKKKGIHLRLLESDPKRCEFLAENLNNTTVLLGDGTDENILKEENAGVMDVVISVTGDEENNILCSLLSKSLGAKQTITRVKKLAYMPIMQKIGLENIVNPRISAANTILKYMRKWVISSFSIKEDAEALEIYVKKDSFFSNKRVKELNLPKGSLILSLTRKDQVIIPSGEDKIFPEDKLILFTKESNIPKFEKLLAKK